MSVAYSATRAHAFAAEQARVDVGAQQHARVAGECRQAADRVRAILLAHPAEFAVGALLDHRDRQERLQALGHADRARARTAAAVRRRERLVQVHVDRVEAHVARPHLAEDRVEVRAVVIEQSAGFVHELGDLDDAPLEHADRRRIGQHDAGRLRAEHLLQRFDVDVAVGIASGSRAPCSRTSIAVAGLVPCAASGTMISVRSRIAAVTVIGHDHRDAGELALRAGHRRERDAAFHAGHVGEDFLQVVHAGQKTLRQRFRRVRMARQESVEHRQRIARARVVFHRARAERIELRVDREVLARQVRVVAQRLQLGNFRQADRRRCGRCLGRSAGTTCRRYNCAAAVRPGWDSSKISMACD